MPLPGVDGKVCVLGIRTWWPPSPSGPSATAARSCAAHGRPFNAERGAKAVFGSAGSSPATPQELASEKEAARERLRSYEASEEPDSAMQADGVMRKGALGTMRGVT